MKTKILLMMPYIYVGGVESTLISLLDSLNPKLVDVDLLIVNKNTDGIDRIPSYANVHYLQIPKPFWGSFYGFKTSIKELISHMDFINMVKVVLNHNLKLTEDREHNINVFNKMDRYISIYEKEYDIAIDYFGYATFTTYYIAEKVKAKKKFTWLHSTMSRFNLQKFEIYYNKYNKIYAVSKMVKRDFESIFPNLENVDLFYNIINPSLIKKKATISGGFDDNYRGIRILTVARICEEKGVDIAAKTFNLLKKAGFNIRWYIIGAGDEETKDEISKITNYDQDFIFLGVKTNPYIYMKQCDIYVQPSRFEGYCTTTNEARILGCPIVMTDVSGAEEQIINGETGYIVPIHEEYLFKAISYLLDNSDVLKSFKDKLLNLKINTMDEISKLFIE